MREITKYKQSKFNDRLKNYITFYIKSQFSMYDYMIYI